MHEKAITKKERKKNLFHNLKYDLTIDAFLVTEEVIFFETIFIFYYI